MASFGSLRRPGYSWTISLGAGGERVLDVGPFEQAAAVGGEEDGEDGEDVSEGEEEDNGGR